MHFAETVVEVGTELMYLEFSCPFTPAPFSYLQEVADMVV
jgi:hypothetical protein